MYGTFAYLSSPAINQVDKLLVVSPLNAFAAWRTEFTAVFGAKRKLHYLNLRDPRLINDQGAIKRAWPRADVITINYESLKGNLRVINELLDSRTMLVFDEVHRIKGINGQRARAALHLSQAPYYRYVLTGTPIPNGFRDVYNFLHLMYPDEYKSLHAPSRSACGTHRHRLSGIIGSRLPFGLSTSNEKPHPKTKKLKATAKSPPSPPALSPCSMQPFGGFHQKRTQHAL